MKTFVVCLWLLIAIVLIGCGGSSGSGDLVYPTVSINWADRGSSRVNAPSSALSLKFIFEGGGQNGQDVEVIIDRRVDPAGYSETIRSPFLVREGRWHLKIKFFSGHGGQGDEVAEADALVDVDANGNIVGNITTEDLIASLYIPAGQFTSVGVLKDVVFTALGPGGQVVGVSNGSGHFSVVTGASLLQFANGQALGLSPGLPQISVSIGNVVSPPQVFEVRGSGQTSGGDSGAYTGVYTGSTNVYTTTNQTNGSTGDSASSGDSAGNTTDTTGETDTTGTTDTTTTATTGTNGTNGTTGKSTGTTGGTTTITTGGHTDGTTGTTGQYTTD